MERTRLQISFICAYDMSMHMVCLWDPQTVYEFVVLMDKPYAHTNFFYVCVWYEYAYGLSMSSTNCLWVRGTHRQTIRTYEFLLHARMIWVCVWFVYEFHELSMSSSLTNHTHIRISFMCAYDMSMCMVCLWVPRTVYEFVVLIDKPYAHTNFVERTLRQIMRTYKRNLYE